MRWLRPVAALSILAATPLLVLSLEAAGKTSSAKKTKTVKKPAKKRARILKAPPVSAKARARASEEVSGMLDRTASIPIENPAAMIPFFEQLRRGATGETAGPL